MAAARKLQGEIDKTLKKIDEGINDWNSLFNKCVHASNHTLKDKYENDLKKEIKKLQRYRESVKAWLSSDEHILVKYRNVLQDARRNIEVLMERFKVLEKETKTKAYSKQGLDNVNNKKIYDSNYNNEYDYNNDNNYELTPEASEVIEYIDNFIDELEEQRDKLQDIVDKTSTTTKVASTKKKNTASSDDNAKHWFDRHNYHIDQLNKIRNGVEHGYIQPSQVDDIKDGIEYYVQHNQSADFEEDEQLYDELDLDIIDNDDNDNDTHSNANDNVNDEHSNQTSDNDYSNDNDTDDTRSITITSVASPQSKPVQIPTNKQTNKTTTIKQSSPTTTHNIPRQQQPQSSAVSKPATTATTTTTTAAQPTPVRQPTATTTTATSAIPTTTSPAKPTESLASILAKGKQQQQTTPVTTPPHIQPQQSAASVVRQASQQQQQQQVTPTTTAAAAAPQASRQLSTTQQVRPTQSAQQQRSTIPQTLDTPIPPIPSITSSNTTNLTEQQINTLQQLQSSLQYLPDTTDTDRPKLYVPRNPYRTPSYFPSTPSDYFSSTSNIWRRFTSDTLFFIFYFQQGTCQQYLAARELKRQSWRYHKNYLTWFQRHDDPIHANDTQETGSFLYFDYEAGWCSRIKHDFTFEYKYLDI